MCQLSVFARLVAAVVWVGPIRLGDRRPPAIGGWTLAATGVFGLATVLVFAYNLADSLVDRKGGHHDAPTRSTAPPL